STSQHLEYSDRSIHITTFLSDTTTIFESDTEQQLYQPAEIPENITNVQFLTLTTESSFFSNKMDTDSIDELVLSGAPPSYLTKEQEQIHPSTPETILNLEQGNLFVSLLEDTVLQLSEGFPSQQTWDHNQSQPTSPTGSDHTQVHTINYMIYLLIMSLQ
ncbi:26650_t:CDS:2, partial [Dentiscutata erythropus]